MALLKVLLFASLAQSVFLSDSLHNLMLQMITVNTILFLFYLLPIPPLDGSHVLKNLSNMKRLLLLLILLLVNPLRFKINELSIFYLFSLHSSNHYLKTMRRIGEFDQEKSALKFWSFLKGQGIDSTLEKDDDDHKWSIWVAEEDKIERSIEELRAFLADPEAKKFISIASSTVTKKTGTENEQKHPNKRKSQGFKEYNLRERWGSRDRSPGVLTLSLIITCVAVFLLSGLGKNTELVGKFFISEKLDGQLSEFTSGQIWRIFTPIFLHFNFLHIAFNMLWLHDLGSQIERFPFHSLFFNFMCFEPSNS